jgi:Protein of unknown function (DUF1501)
LQGIRRVILPQNYTDPHSPVSVHDLHATVLHLMGIDHTRLTYKFQGREFRLTDVEGVVMKKPVS